MHLLNKTKHLLHKYNIRPKKRLGQNFCVDSQLFERMVAYANLCSDDIVLEVGSGFGFLTCLLTNTAKRVFAVELDPKLVTHLKSHLADRDNVTIIPGNILNMEIPPFNKVVANIPYAISSPLITYLLMKSLDCAVLTLQKEFATRLTAQVGTKKYGFLAVVTDYKASVDVLEPVSKEAFYPPPQVESVVVVIKTCDPRFDVYDERLFLRLIKHLFTQRRRIARKPFEAFLQKEARIGKTEARLVIEGIPLVGKRVCDMKPEDFGVLANEVYPFLQGKKIAFKNRRLYVFPEVYEPCDDSFLLANCLDVKKGERVLDIGTGCGLLGILAAEKAESVIATDVNPHALRCTEFNAKLNSVADKVVVVLSDIFSALGERDKFDSIIFNPPYLPMDGRVRSSGWIERAWYGGVDGREVIDRFIKNVRGHVSENGKVIMVQSSLSNPDTSLKLLRDRGFETDIVAEKELFFETLVVIRARYLQ